MKRITGLIVVLLVAFMLNAVAVAQDDAVSLCGTFSGSANLLPTVSSLLGLSLTLSFGNLTAISNTNFTVLPSVSATQRFTLEYALDPLTFGTDVNLGVVPLAFQSWDVYARLDLPDTTIGDGDGAPSFGGYLRADATILPAFASTSTLYLSMDVGPLSASSKSVVGIVPFSFQTQRFDLSIDFLSAAFGEGDVYSMDGKLETRIDVLPTLGTTVWLDLSLSFGDLEIRSYTSLDVIPTVAGTTVFTLTYSIESITLTSKTTFDLSPFGFDSEYIKIDVVVYDGLSFYGWGQFASGGPSAGIGFSYAFCTESN